MVLLECLCINCFRICGMSMILDYIFPLERLLRTRLKHLRMLVLVLNMLSLRQPTKWFPVSNVPYMLCTTHFHLKICSHNLCYFFCAIFCGCFSEGRILMPLKFMISNPQRACDVCGVSWVYSALFVLVNFQLNTLFMPPAINHFNFFLRKCLQDPSHNKWIGSNLAIPGNMMKMVN